MAFYCCGTSCTIIFSFQGLLWDEMEMTQQEISPCELTLECRPSAKRSHTVVGDETQQLERYLQGLQTERQKIEAFKRELPFSMRLLDDAIEASEQQLENCENFKRPLNEEQNGPKSVLQEFIPVNKTSCEESAGNKYEGIEVKGESAYTTNDMPKWMISPPLWSHNDETKQTGLKQQDSHPQQSFALHRGPGAFLPFSREQNENPRFPHPDQLSQGGEEVDSHGISSCKMVVSLKNKSDEDGNGFKKTFEAQDFGVPKTSDGANPNSNTSPTECQRKPRRCWSQELHRKFVDALQHLGGSQATPKQIRELMKVDGLTNDEVKSHLQKYRLHTRRLSPPSSTIAQSQVPPHLVVVGGIWVHPEHASTRGQGLYAALPAIQHGHFYCQPSNSAINGAEDFCSQRINTPLYDLQEEPRGSAHSWGVGVYTKSKSFDMKEEDEDSERGNEEMTRNFGRGLSLRRSSQ